MTDFSHLAGPSEEWASYLAKNPLPKVDVISTEFRRAHNPQRYAARDAAMKALGDHQVTWETLTIPTSDSLEIPIRVFRSATQKGHASVLIYYHGGGFLTGSISTEDPFCISLARDTGFTVISVGYRVIPEWKAPTQFNDAWDARTWVINNAAELGLPQDFDLYVAGTSAGGFLAASVVHRERELGESYIKGQVLAAPWLVLTENFPFDPKVGDKTSHIQWRDADFLSYPQIEQYRALMGVPDELRDSLLLNPLLFDEKSSIKDLPPTLVMACGDDPLRDQGLIYQQKLDRLGVPTKLNTYAGYPHVFWIFPDLAMSKTWYRDLLEGLQWLSEKQGHVRN
ncbi:Abhydrolase_3 domain-containing protein [Trichoderma simmonsii]|uniref:Abhydrolase_3 domain-containing protein n=1 Tax=Trichoderma simmonsii TaxID=1491479 RepID=A0A8G0LKY6_9HYPO|nr:Abhydrolase_3 domain-containing protein [Trichoderma simmonsii]